MKWVNGYRYDFFTKNTGEIFHAGLTHRCVSCGAAVIKVPDWVETPEHQCDFYPEYQSQEI